MGKFLALVALIGLHIMVKYLIVTTSGLTFIMNLNILVSSSPIFRQFFLSQAIQLALKAELKVQTINYFIKIKATIVQNFSMVSAIYSHKMPRY